MATQTDARDIDGASVRAATTLSRVTLQDGREDVVSGILRPLLEHADRLSALVVDDVQPALFFDPRRCS